MDHQIVGNAMQMVIMTLSPGDVVYCEAGKFLFSSGDVQMETRMLQPSSQQALVPSVAGGGTPGAGGSGGSGGPGGPGGSGKFGGLLRGAMETGKRVLAGESFAFQQFHTDGGDGLVAFAGSLPGEVRALTMSPGETWLAEKDAFVVAEGQIRFDIAFSGLRQGIAGGEGFVLEKFTPAGDRSGTVFVAGAGNFVDLNPADYGGTIHVDTGCIVAFESAVSYDVRWTGGLSRKGIMNALFGGEGLFLATLRGNGRVILQSMTVGALANSLEKHMHSGRESGSGGASPLGGLSGLLRSSD